MRIISFYFNDTTTIVYFMSKGETIGRHNHLTEKVGHTTGVASGRSRVTIYRNNVPSENKYAVLSQFELTPENVHSELDYKTDHDIEALEDGTVVIHMHKGKRNQPQEYTPKSGGIMLADGSIVDEKAS